MSKHRPHRPQSWQICFLIADNRESEGSPANFTGITPFMAWNSSCPWVVSGCIGKSPRHDCKMPPTGSHDCFSTSAVIAHSSCCVSSSVRAFFPASSSRPYFVYPLASLFSGRSLDLYPLFMLAVRRRPNHVNLTCLFFAVSPVIHKTCVVAPLDPGVGTRAFQLTHPGRLIYLPRQCEGPSPPQL